MEIHSKASKHITLPWAYIRKKNNESYESIRKKGNVYAYPVKKRPSRPQQRNGSPEKPTQLQNIRNHYNKVSAKNKKKKHQYNKVN